MKKTTEELDALKSNWAHDPCWDIEDTPGFEDHKEELIAWRKDQKRKHAIARKVHEENRFQNVMELTGVTNREIALSLHTFDEIENDCINGETNRALVHATLLQAAQLKRIADALESIAEGSRLEETVAIWGSK